LNYFVNAPPSLGANFSSFGKYPANPLWYMDVLEKALANNWILTTDEVEKLIGVKPHCEHNQTEYRRGCWIFTKTGKVGAKTGWSVDKVVES
ncbi:MAG: hypothetical protein AAGM29_22740, partial [Cyanobacteria bacterium J06588_4]